MSAALSALVRTNPCAFLLISAMGRNYPLCRNVSRSRAQTILQAEGENFPSDQVVEALRSMSQAGLGNLRWIDGTEEFNFAWALTPATVLESVRSGLSLDAVTADFKPAREDDFDMELEDPLCKHRFQLRRDCVIGLELPENLTKREARMIFKFLKALAFRVETWPFPTSFIFKEGDSPAEDFDEVSGDSDDKADAPSDGVDNDEFDEDLTAELSSDEVSVKNAEKPRVDWDNF